jgi:hypothetical protein
VNKARLFVRLVESEDGSWELRRGSHVVAELAAYDDALEVATELARLLAPSAVFVHRTDGSVTSIERFD